MLRRSKTKEPMLFYEIPELPFYKLAIDILYFDGQCYLVVGDYYRWIKLYEFKLYNKTIDSVLEVLKELFDRLVIL